MKNTSKSGLEPHQKKPENGFWFRKNLQTAYPKHLGWRLPKVKQPKMKGAISFFIPALSLFLHLSRKRGTLWGEADMISSVSRQESSVSASFGHLRIFKSLLCKTADLTSVARKPAADSCTWATTSLLSPDDPGGSNGPKPTPMVGAEWSPTSTRKYKAQLWPLLLLLLLSHFNHVQLGATP